MAISRLEFMTKVGAKMTNHQWSWVGVDSERKRVYFSTWHHYKARLNNVEQDVKKQEFLIFYEKWGQSGVALGHSDAKRALRLIYHEDYTPCLMLLEATFRFEYPDRLPGQEVSIKKVKGDDFYTAVLRREGIGTDEEMVFAEINGQGSIRYPDIIKPMPLFSEKV